LIESQQKHAQALEHGREAFMAAGIGHAEWRGVDGFPTEALLAHARGADLLIASRPGHGAVPSRSVNPADLAMRSGLPLLLLPEALEELRPRRILIGWKDSRESRRAVGDALPLLRRAEHVVLSAVAEGEDEASTIASLNDVAQRLLRHDVAVEIQLEPKAPAGVLDTLLRSASTHQADLLVLGAYGHSRAREWLFGGVTEAVLDASPIAVLLSH
jgi:nucleotide-binding universal stress UspA family protein